MTETRRTKAYTTNMYRSPLPYSPIGLNQKPSLMTMMGSISSHPKRYAVGRVLSGSSQKRTPVVCRVVRTQSQCIRAARGRKKRMLNRIVFGRPYTNKSLPDGVILSLRNPSAIGSVVQRQAERKMLAM